MAGRRAPADRLRAGGRDGSARRGGAGPGARERPRRGVRRRPARLDVRRRRGARAAPRGDDRVLPVGPGARRLDRDEPRRHGRRATSRGRRPPSARWATSAPRTASGSRSRLRRRRPSSTRSSGCARCSRGRDTRSCGLLVDAYHLHRGGGRPARRRGSRSRRDRLRPVQRRAGLRAPARPDPGPAAAGPRHRPVPRVLPRSSSARDTRVTAPTRRRIPPPGRATP